MFWHCWLGGRKGIQPVKNWWGAGVVICLECSADLHMAQLMPLPLTVSCFSKIQIGFTFLVLAHPGSPGQRAVKRVCVCVPNQSMLDISWQRVTDMLVIVHHRQFTLITNSITHGELLHFRKSGVSRRKLLICALWGRVSSLLCENACSTGADKS